MLTLTNLIGFGVNATLVPSKPTVTWNPADKSSAVSLSNGNLDATLGNEAAGSLVRATLGASAGKVYWEVEVVSFASFHPMIGIALASAQVNAYPGYTAPGWSVWGYDGNKYNAGVGSTANALFSSGAVIGNALDMDNKTWTVLINNVSKGVMFSGLSGTVFPAVGNPGGGSQNVRGKFRTADFVYAPPAGFEAIGG